MALTQQQKTAAQQTLGQISSTLSGISAGLKSNPSAYNNTALGNRLGSALGSLGTGLRSFGSYAGINLPQAGESNFQVNPVMDFSDFSKSLNGVFGVTPYTPVDPSSFVGSLPTETPKQLSATEVKINELQSEREGYYNQLDSMSSRYKQMQDQAGITSGLRELANVNRQIMQKKLDFEATNKQIVGQTIPTPIILKQQEVNRSAAAAEISAYSAYAQAIQGNIEMATNLINKSIEIEYKPVLARIDYIKEQIQEQYSNMDREERKKAPFIQAQLDIYKSQVLDFTEQKRNAMNNAIYNKAPQSVYANIQKAQTMQELANVGGSYIRDPKTVAEIAKIYSDIQSGGGVGDPVNILAYAQQYASTGTIPTGLPKGTFGVVSQIAKELPKPAGTLVDINTGIKSSSLSPSQEDAIIAGKDLVNRLNYTKELFSKISTGALAATFGGIFPSKERQAYNATKAEIVDLLARMRTGAVINAEEEKNYASKLPTTWNRTFWLGPSGKEAISNLLGSISGKLDTALSTNGLAIYGYTKVNLGKDVNGKDVTARVGDIITGADGTKGRVNPDGTITIIQ